MRRRGPRRVNGKLRVFVSFVAEASVCVCVCVHVLALAAVAHLRAFSQVKLYGKCVVGCCLLKTREHCVEIVRASERAIAAKQASNSHCKCTERKTRANKQAIKGQMSQANSTSCKQQTNKQTHADKQTDRQTDGYTDAYHCIVHYAHYTHVSMQTKPHSFLSSIGATFKSCHFRLQIVTCLQWE